VKGAIVVFFVVVVFFRKRYCLYKNKSINEPNQEVLQKCLDAKYPRLCVGWGGVIREMSVVTIKVTDLNQVNESNSNEGPALIKSNNKKRKRRTKESMGAWQFMACEKTEMVFLLFEEKGK
jgi:hypothetical protein